MISLANWRRWQKIFWKRMWFSSRYSKKRLYSRFTTLTFTLSNALWKFFLTITIKWENRTIELFMQIQIHNIISKIWYQRFHRAFLFVAKNTTSTYFYSKSRNNYFFVISFYFSQKSFSNSFSSFFSLFA